MNEPIAYINGERVPARQAAVPVSDAGFVLGASVADQLRTFGGKLFRLDDHLARLARSLEIVGIEPEMTLDELAAIAGELVAHNHALLATDDDLALSIVITPGTHPSFARPGPRRPHVYLHTFPLPFHLWADKYRDGQPLATTDVEQVPPQCWPPELKCRSRMHYYLADKKAAAVDAQARALLLDSRGFVTEASTASMLIYREGEGILSPPWDNVLHGVSRMVLGELARRLGIPCGEEELTAADVASADEVLLTSTSMSVVPVTRLNGRPIRDGRPGPVFSALLAAWSELVGVDIADQSQRYKCRGAS
jgi:branched-chain amino acid aminotransferase